MVLSPSLTWWLGRQHALNGRLRHVQDKNSRRKPVVVDIAMPPDRQPAPGIIGKLTFLVTDYGRRSCVARFGNNAEGCILLDISDFPTGHNCLAQHQPLG